MTSKISRHLLLMQKMGEFNGEEPNFNRAEPNFQREEPKNNRVGTHPFLAIKIS